MLQNLYGVSEGINNSFAEQVHGLAKNAEPITKVIGGVYLAVGAYMVAKVDARLGITFVAMGGIMTRMRIRMDGVLIDDIETPELLEPILASEAEEAIKDRELDEHIGKLQADQLRRHLRGDPGLDSKDDL